MFKRILRRLLLLFLISTAAVGIISEGVYLLQKDPTDRPPKTIELVIPVGTSSRVAAGEAISSLPEKMSFVVGDVLVVKNEDSVSHQLGPMWLPAGASGSLTLGEANKFSYECSFQPTKFLGLDVRKSTTWVTRLTALSVAVPATVAILFVYSILVWPLEPKSK